jgi:protease IV
MGGVAASGGYYVSAGATAIYAEPTTITGSIGVYSGKFNTAKLFKSIGIQVEEEARGRHASLYTTSRPWDELERKKMEEMVESTYVRFKERVGDGRELSPDDVEKVARGRVWSGTQAKEMGLVDEMGGLFDAVERARIESGIPRYAKVNTVAYKGGSPGYSPYTQRLKTELQSIAPTPQLLAPSLVETLENESLWMIMPYIVEIK